MDSTKAEEAVRQMSQLKIDLKSPNLFFAQFEDLIEKAGFDLLHPKTNLNFLCCLPEWLLCKVCDLLKPNNYTTAKNKALGIIKSQQAIDGILQKTLQSFQPQHLCSMQWQQNPSWHNHQPTVHPYTGQWQPPTGQAPTQGYNLLTTPSWYKDVWGVPMDIG